MASAEGAAGPEDVPPEFECTICMKLLLDPVTVSCGHTFCRTCLEQSLGYRGLCAVCRAPVAAGQGVNILVRGIIAERFPQALEQRKEELREELMAGEREADEARRREARGPSAAEGNEAGGRVLPLLVYEQGECFMPYCRAEVELSDHVEQQMLQYALRGPRRFGVVDRDAAYSYDEDCQAMGVCMEIVNVERLARPDQQQAIRVQLMGKFRFWLADGPPQAHEDGFLLGKAEAFFDQPLETADLMLPRERAADAQAEVNEGEAAPQQPAAAEVARHVLDLLERQLVHVGQAGRHLFHMHFGEVPSLRGEGATGATTSASLERLSFWLLGALRFGQSTRRQWLACVDTRARLEGIKEELEAAGTRPVLDLPGSRSWMNPGQSALGHFLLLIAIIAFFVAKATGLFERGFRGGSVNQAGMEEAFAFGQLMR